MDMVPTSELKTGDYFAKAGQIYRVLSDPKLRIEADRQISDDRPDYTIHTLTPSGIEAFWDSHHWDKVRIIPSDQVETIHYVAIYLGGSVLRFIDPESLNTIWPDVLSHQDSESMQPRVHVGKVLDQDRRKVNGVVMIDQIKAVTEGQITIQTGVKEF